MTDRGWEFSRRARAEIGGEEGLSLAEVLISLFILSSVLVLLASALLQFMRLTRFGNDRMLATSDLQTAQLWLGRDAAEAATFTPGSGPVYGTFDWPGGDPQFEYSYRSADSSLVRTRLEGGSAVSTVATARHIAQQSDITFVLDGDGDKVTVSITATSGAETSSAEFELFMRVR